MSRAEEVAKHGRTPSASKGQAGNAWRGFVDIPLTDDHKDQIRSMEDDPAEMWQIVRWIVEGGYKLSISMDDKHHCATVAMTCRLEGHRNENQTLTGRGPDVTTALNVVWFKHYVLAQDGLWDSVASERTLPDIM